MLGVSAGFRSMLKEGLLDLPSEAVWGLPPMGAVPQSASDLRFGIADLETGCRSGVYEELSSEQAEDLVRRGFLISSAFTVWQGDDGDRKGRFVVNFSRQSKFWTKGSVQMEKLVQFSDELRRGESLISFDLAAGYRHVFLHPAMLDFFVFSYGGRTFRCLALPFGWGRSAFHFTRLLRPVVRYLRNVLGYRVLWYLDDFLIAPRGGRGATPEDCLIASGRIDTVLTKLGLQRHATKGVWHHGATELEHLGFMVSTLTMKFTVTPSKQRRMRRLAGKLLRQASQGRGLVSADLLSSFCGSAVSLTLAVPLARFYSRSLYKCLWQRSPELRGKGRTRVRLTKAGRRDLKFWRGLGPEGRCMQTADTILCVHSDAADVGWGGTIGKDMAPGSAGSEMQGLWNAEERAKTIAWRELKALRLVLQSLPATQAVLASTRGPSERTGVRCWVDNRAVVHIVRAMVTASDELMPELRRLQDVIGSRGIELDVRWIPSAENRNADRLSRTWDPAAPQVSRSVIASLATLMRTVVGKGTVFRHRASGGEHPVAQRKQAEAAMAEYWGDGRARFFNPPPELLGLTLAKVAREGGRGVVLVPLWIETSYTARLRRMADPGSVQILRPAPNRPLVAGARSGTETCPLMLATVGLKSTPSRPGSPRS